MNPVEKQAFPSLLHFGAASILWVLGALGTAIFAPPLHAQQPQSPPAESSGGGGWLWVEQFSGSANSEGSVLAMTSTGGYNFNPHVGVFSGLPVYFVHSTLSSDGSTVPAGSEEGIGDFFVGLRLTFDSPAVNYRMTLSGGAPTGDASKGFGTGHATFNWNNHFEHSFGRFTPFANGGIANSIPDTLFYQRQYVTYGYLADVQAGAAVRVVGPLSAIVAGYDIAPWGSQQEDSRLVDSGVTGLLGTLTGGRVFETAHATTGGPSLTADDGVSAGVDVSLLRTYDFWCGYNRSFALALNTVSFGLGVNVSNIVRAATGK